MVTNRQITITKEQYVLSVTPELVNTLNKKFGGDKSFLAYYLTSLCNEGTKFADQRNFEWDIQQRLKFHTELQSAAKKLLASGPQGIDWVVPFASLAVSVGNVDAALNVIASVKERAIRANLVYEKMCKLIGATLQSNEEIAKACNTCLLFFWLFTNAERFTFNIRTRVEQQLEIVKKGFLAGSYPAMEKLEDAYESMVLTSFFDLEVMKAIQEDIPQAKDKNIVWPTVEHLSNVVIITEGNESYALDIIEKELTKFMEGGLLLLERGLGSTDLQKFCKSLVPQECYPGRVANIQEALRPAPPPLSLLARVKKVMLGKNVALDTQAAIFTIADYYSDLHKGATWDEFVVFATAQLQGPLAELEILPTQLTAEKDNVSYMFS